MAGICCADVGAVDESGEDAADDADEGLVPSCVSTLEVSFHVDLAQPLRKALRL